LWALVAVGAVWLAIAGQRRLYLREYAADGVFFLAIAIGLFLVAVASQHRDVPLLWPQNSAPQQDTLPRVSLTRGRLQRLLLAITVLFAVVCFASLAKNHFTVRGILCWWGAILAWLLAMLQIRPGLVKRLRSSKLSNALRTGLLETRISWVLLSMLCILALSFFFHVYRISSVPAEAQSDHVEASEDVRSILNGQYMIYFPRNTGREPTQFYLTAALSHIFGYGFTTLKLTMALVGALNVIPMYWLGKELADRRLGLLAAFFTAISYWHLIVSRIGWRIVLAPLWTTVTLYCILRAFRTGRRNDYLLTGLALGAGLYGYMSFRVTPLLIIVLFVLKAIVDREPGFRLTDHVANLGTLGVSALLVYLPLLRYMYDEPRMYWYRVLTRTTDLERPVMESSLAIFVDNVKRALLMFNWNGDFAWTVSVPNKPVLDYVSAGLFVLGTAYLLYLLLAKRRPLALYLFVALFMVLLPSTMSVAFPIENPSNIRASGVIPIMILLVALPAYLVGRQVVQTLRGGTGLVLVTVLGALLLGRATQLNYRLYFVDYDQEYRRSAWNASDMARVMTGFANSLGNIYDAYEIGTAYWVSHRAIALTLGNMEWDNLIMDMSQAEPHLADPRNRLYIYHPGNSEAEAWLLEHYPNGQLMRFQASLPDKDFMIYYAPARR